MFVDERLVPELPESESCEDLFLEDGENDEEDDDDEDLFLEERELGTELVEVEGPLEPEIKLPIIWAISSASACCSLYT